MEESCHKTVFGTMPDAGRLDRKGASSLKLNTVVLRVFRCGTTSTEEIVGIIVYCIAHHFWLSFTPIRRSIRCCRTHIGKSRLALNLTIFKKPFAKGRFNRFSAG